MPHEDTVKRQARPGREVRGGELARVRVTLR
jgi:hypothetical protein